MPFLRFAELSDSVAPLIPTVSPTAVTRYLLLVDAQGDRGVQRCSLVHVLLRCRRTRGATHGQRGLYWPGHIQILGMRMCRFACTCSRRSTSGPQNSPGRMANRSPVHRYAQPRLVMWPPSSAVRQAASLLGMPLEPLTGATSGTPSRALEPCTSHPMVSMCGGSSCMVAGVPVLF